MDNLPIEVLDHVIGFALPAISRSYQGIIVSRRDSISAHEAFKRWCYDLRVICNSLTSVNRIFRKVLLKVIHDNKRVQQLLFLQCQTQISFTLQFRGETHLRLEFLDHNTSDGSRLQLQCSFLVHALTCGTKTSFDQVDICCNLCIRWLPLVLHYLKEAESLGRKINVKCITMGDCGTHHEWERCNRWSGCDDLVRSFQMITKRMSGQRCVFAGVLICNICGQLDYDGDDDYSSYVCVSCSHDTT